MRTRITAAYKNPQTEIEHLTYTFRTLGVPYSRYRDGNGEVILIVNTLTTFRFNGNGSLKEVGDEG